MFSHTAPDDVDVLLVGPTGQSVVVMADTGGGLDATNVSLTLDDAAAASLPDESLIASGTYKPTIGSLSPFGGCCGWSGVAPAPAGPYGTTLDEFNGTAPNGVWNLFVYDDTFADQGSIAGGWSIEITLGTPTITSFTPTSGPRGTPVAITGTFLSGATSVTFGGASATFTVNSATQITATVPDGGTTGPIIVRTPNGTAVSSSIFAVTTVDHPRQVTLRVGNKAKGKVRVPDGYAACASDVGVRVQHREGGSWRSMGHTTTSPEGSFLVPGTKNAGKYRAIAKEVLLPSGDVCLKAVSKVVKR